MPEIFLRKTLRRLADAINPETSALAAVVMQVLGHIGLRISLPPLEDPNSDGILIVLHGKLSKFVLSDDVEAVRKIVISIGHICVKEPFQNSHDKPTTAAVTMASDQATNLCTREGKYESGSMQGHEPTCIPEHTLQNMSR